MEEKNPIQVADRIFQVIETLSAKGNLGLDGTMQGDGFQINYSFTAS